LGFVSSPRKPWRKPRFAGSASSHVGLSVPVIGDLIPGARKVRSPLNKESPSCPTLS
jgi:hypothetical protein